MKTVHEENMEMLARVVAALPSWKTRVLFIGGSTLGFYVDSALHGVLRNTLDVDLVIEVASLSKFYVLSDELRKSGFVELPERISRWKFKDLLLDILPSDVSDLHPRNPWISEAFDRSVSQEIGPNVSILLPSFYDFLALKFQAFRDRGNNDFLAIDMEDIVTLIDGCPNELLNVEDLSLEISNFLGSALNALLSNSDFLNLLPGLLFNSSIIRVQRFKSRVNQILSFVTLV